MRYFFILLFSFFTLFSKGQGGVEMFYALNGNSPCDVSTNDADALAYFARLQAKGVTLTHCEKKARNTYITGLKTKGVWAQVMDRQLPIYPAAYEVTLKNAVVLAFPGGVPTYSAKGARFPGTTFISTGINPAASLPVNSVHLSYYEAEDTISGSTNNPMGAQTGTNGDILTFNIRNTSNLIRWVANAMTLTGSVTNTSTKGYYTMVRSAADYSAMYKNGTLVESSTQASTTRANNPIAVGGRAQFTMSAAFKWTGTCAMWSVGFSLTPQQVSDDNQLTEELLDALGIGVQ